jgi:hypothetical protein
MVILLVMLMINGTGSDGGFIYDGDNDGNNAS